MAGRRFKKILSENGLTNIFIHKALVCLNPESIEIRDEAKNKYGVYVAVGVGGLKKFIESVYIDAKFDTALCLKIYETLRVLSH